MFWKIYFWFLCLMLTFTYVVIFLGKAFSAIFILDLIISLPSMVGFFLYAYRKILFSAKFWKVYVPVYYIWDICFNLFIMPTGKNVASATISFLPILPMWIALYLYAFKFRNKYSNQSQVDAEMKVTSSKKKGCLIVFIIIITILTLFIIGILSWVVANKNKMMAGHIKITEEAKNFAESSDSDGCLQETLSQVSKSKTVISEVGTEIFLSKCLELAKYTSGFCDNIPREKAILKRAVWKVQKCADNPNPQGCRRLWNTVEEFCSARDKERLK